MVKEVLFYLDIKPHLTYVDGTVGQGGHTGKILSHLSLKGNLIGVDRDNEVLEICQQKFSASNTQLSLYHNSYHHLPEILQEEGIQSVEGILLDLGLSTFQLDSENRGFSYSQDSRLDMRFDQASGKPAVDFLKKLTRTELETILKEFGEERFSRKIAYHIHQSPELKTTSDLKNIIKKSTPPAHRIKSFSRVFQAIRIAVNGELEILKKFLDSFIDYLSIGGKIVIISYHSLEDRLVKQAFKRLKQTGAVAILTKKPVTPSQEEISKNSRSRSAKLRAAERI
jgi:16S rRNA (cytosine1402-N4)-methyltransferase